ncbi:c-type cytochrome biogenesis protein CcmI [Comamonas sp. 17RB]|uniref:c-type cytochrome biogenesis protein CcmI n=1 Tax=Comamonas sp. 17RB TaxID=3047025 RepID=UPI0024B7B7EE|nr:c-type cytochrome biogenesis protein CcmI [Comamonas sp. 17RB]MDI9854639.1 c-type cytochrome biogenesis protein CcmI [Comamonas sp. 17RB]
MNDVQLLWVGVLALILLSLGVLLPALLVEVAPESLPRSDDALRRLYQTQLAELERERAGERLSATDHAQAVEELQARLLAELERRTPAGLRRHSVWLQRGSGLLLAVLLPVGALLLYTQVGDPQAVVRLGQVQESDHMAQEGQVQAMVASLAHKLQEEPQNLPGWLMLARSYETLERYGDAAQAYQQALQEARRSGLDTDTQARLLADQADALASAAGGSLEGEAGAAIAQALRLQPTQAKALALAGSAAVRRGDIALARQHWQALLAQMEPGSDMALRVQDDLLKLETLQAGPDK